MRMLCALIIVLLFTSPVLSSELEKLHSLQNDEVPQVRLISPISENVDVTGKDTLEFKWSPHEGVSGYREYYDFRLYKGYNMVETALVIKIRLSGDAYQFNVNADKFEKGRAYTWSVIQGYSGLKKSKEAFATFKIVNN